MTERQWQQTVRARHRGIPHRPARAWFLIAFALLAGGVAGGGLTKQRHWAWIFPAGGFVAHVVAFRHALQLARPDGVDDLWRSPSLWTEPQRDRRSRVWWLWRWGGRRDGEVARGGFRKGRPPEGRRSSARVGG